MISGSGRSTTLDYSSLLTSSRRSVELARGAGPTSTSAIVKAAGEQRLVDSFE